MVENRPLKICIMGASTSTNNRGVSALAVSLVKIFLQIDPDTKLSFVTGSRTSEPQKISLKDKDIFVPTFGYRLSLKSPPGQHLFMILLLAFFQRFVPLKMLREKIINRNLVLREMYSADFIADIQGGDSFSDIYGLVGYIIGIIPMFIALLLGKKLVLLPQTYGPYKSLIAKELAKIVIKNAFYCFSRDHDGVEQLRSIIKKGKTNYSFCPDVAFMLDPVKPKQMQIEPSLQKQNKLLIGLNVNGLMFNGGYTRKNMFGLEVNYKKLVIEIIEMFLEQDVKIILIPHTYGLSGNVNSDPQASEEVIKLFENKQVYILKGEYSQSEVKGIIGTCDFFIGSRMHACIAALSQGIPTIGVAYSKKFIGVFDSVGAGDMVIDCRNTDAQSIISKICEIFKEKMNCKSDITKKVGSIQSKIHENFNLIFIKKYDNKL